MWQKEMENDFEDDEEERKAQDVKTKTETE